MTPAQGRPKGDAQRPPNGVAQPPPNPRPTVPKGVPNYPPYTPQGVGRPFGGPQRRKVDLEIGHEAFS
jgi:hypothetical protein